MQKTATILLQLQRPEDVLIHPVILFNDNRLLKREVEQFITRAVESMDDGAGILLQLEVKEKGISAEHEIQTAIHKHFQFCMQSSQKQLRHTLRMGWKSLLIGIVFLITILFLTRYFVLKIPEGGLMITIRELLIILGWVALWRPVELLLYEWRPHRRQAKLYERLSNAEVRITTKE